MSLRAVRRATVARRKAEAQWRSAIRDAVAAGASHRAVAAEAEISHTRVQQILRDQ